MEMTNVGNLLELRRIYSRGITGKGITTAVLDTGIYAHPDFFIPQNKILYFQDFVRNRRGPFDDNGHGTHVSGIIASGGRFGDGSGIGVAPESSIVMLKVLERVYEVLKKEEFPETKLGQLESDFRVDDHSYWPKDEDKKKQSQIENQWQDISERMETEMETFSKEASESSGGLINQVKVENRERMDYREFLRKFSVLKEEMTVDPDSFDYNFYSYGLSLYGNMPLIEPQEWKEVQKVEEFVIVIDTSMSCSGELVRKFLEETYGVLSENDSFFRKVNIHIIQCDDQIQTDQKITCEEELKSYMEKLELKGEGGTDFRPAFAYVDEMIRQHAFEHLRGMIYFTDGRGIYPAKRPVYETAFVFMEEEYEDVDVPPWAIKIILEEGQDF